LDLHTNRDLQITLLSLSRPRSSKNAIKGNPQTPRFTPRPSLDKENREDNQRKTHESGSLGLFGIDGYLRF